MKDVCVNTPVGCQLHKNTFFFMTVISTVFGKHRETSWISFSSSHTDVLCCRLNLMSTHRSGTNKQPTVFVVLCWECRHKFTRHKDAFCLTTIVLLVLILITLQPGKPGLVGYHSILNKREEIIMFKSIWKLKLFLLIEGAKQLKGRIHLLSWNWFQFVVWRMLTANTHHGPYRPQK